ncbi:MAG TPA: cupredoxin domain-containing protein [Actinomycetota bacterium]|jgi:plastocyanin
MRRLRLVRLLVLFLALGLVAAACSSKKSEGSEGGGGTMTIGSDKANNHGTKDFSGKDEAEVELDNFYFSPTELKGTAGSQIKLELDNEAKGALHNFTLQDQNIDMDVPSGQKVDVTVTFPQSGFLEFFCKYHKSRGMVGELSV